jgi:hypothetical protein
MWWDAATAMSKLMDQNITGSDNTFSNRHCNGFWQTYGFHMRSDSACTFGKRVRCNHHSVIWIVIDTRNPVDSKGYVVTILLVTRLDSSTNQLEVTFLTHQKY